MLDKRKSSKVHSFYSFFENPATLAEVKISRHRGRPQKFFQEGGNVEILLILFRLLTMQCKWTFTKRFTLSTPQRQCPILRQESQKCTSLAAIATSQVYCDIIYTIGYLQIFQSRALFFKEALPWSLTKPQIMTLFYPTRLVSVTSEQERQRLGTQSEITTKP